MDPDLNGSSGVWFGRFRGRFSRGRSLSFEAGGFRRRGLPLLSIFHAILRFRRHNIVIQFFLLLHSLIVSLLFFWRRGCGGCFLLLLFSLSLSPSASGHSVPYGASH